MFRSGTETNKDTHTHTHTHTHTKVGANRVKLTYSRLI